MPIGHTHDVMFNSLTLPNMRPPNYKLHCIAGYHALAQITMANGNLSQLQSNSSQELATLREASKSAQRIRTVDKGG